MLQRVHAYISISVWVWVCVCVWVGGGNGLKHLKILTHQGDSDPLDIAVVTPSVVTRVWFDHHQMNMRLCVDIFMHISIK